MFDKTKVYEKESEELLKKLRKEHGSSLKSLKAFQQLISTASEVSQGIAGNPKYSNIEKKEVIDSIANGINAMYSDTANALMDIKRTVEKSEVFAIRTKISRSINPHA